MENHSKDPQRNASPKPNADRVFQRAREVIRIEADAVLGLLDQLDHQLVQAAQQILNCTGRVVVSGIGKSGHVANKVAATLASTGTPAYFVHPAEAQHGDLGMIQANDVVLAFSNSGETEELAFIAPHIKRLGALLIAITGNPESSLAKAADLHLNAAVRAEACPLNLAPTASTTAALALGDALALVLLDLRGFSAEDFARSHPGGSLGRRLLIRVEDVMRTDGQLPSVRLGTSITDAFAEISAKRMGMTAVLDPDGRVMGIFTDGDLRRVLSQGVDIRKVKIDDVMSKQPKTIDRHRLASEVAHLMESTRINHLLVVDDVGRLEGAVGIHDLFESKIL
ncbi:MAG: KpsF/GutQ family sugar-phosphate isomerase [Betaproteobacteria bacterium]|jgi:arabinose-5-phosphate isomerase|nr:KpsF/GutQ family sugar-phosphate isomerase [Betaproteobacteria bacterium]